MSIPKIIHYCWFGGNEKPEIVLKCIESWKKYCPDWEIKEWNETNIDVNFCWFSKRAYETKRWGFVPDPIRFKIIYEWGGVYLDGDAEMVAPIDELLEYGAVWSYATKTEIGSGLMFGAVKGHPFVKKMLDHYTSLSKESDFIVSTEQETPLFKKEYPEFYGTKEYRKDQILGAAPDDILILWDIWKYTKHHYMGSWQSPRQKFLNKITPKFVKTIYGKIKKKIKARHK